MSLRRRFQTDETQPAKQRLFTPSPLSVVPSEFKPAMEYYINSIPDDCSYEERSQNIKTMAMLYKDYSKIIDRLANDPDKLTEVLSGFNQAIQNNDVNKIESILLELNVQPLGNASTHTTTSFLKSLGSSLSLAALSNVSPTLGVLTTVAALVAPSAAQSFSVFTGKPSGGRDLCDGITNCVQGYLSNGVSTTQFNRVNQFGVNSKSSSYGAQWQMDECLSTEKVGASLKEILDQHTLGNVTSDCAASSTVWNGVQPISTATNINNIACTGYTNNFNSLAQSCMSQSKMAGYDWAIAGSVIGGIIVLAGIITAVSVLCCCKNDIKKKCCS